MAMAELGLISTMAGKNSKLELGRARFKAGWGRESGGLMEKLGTSRIELR